MKPELFALTHDTSKCTARIKQLIALLEMPIGKSSPGRYHEMLFDTATELDSIIDTYYKTQTDETK